MEANIIYEAKNDFFKRIIRSTTLCISNVSKKHIVDRVKVGESIASIFDDEDVYMTWRTDIIIAFPNIEETLQTWTSVKCFPYHPMNKDTVESNNIMLRIFKVLCINYHMNPETNLCCVETVFDCISSALDMHAMSIVSYEHNIKQPNIRQTRAAEPRPPRSRPATESQSEQRTVTPITLDPKSTPNTRDPKIMPNTRDPKIMPNTRDPKLMPNTAEQNIIIKFD
jgi:hypothetical protein